MSTTTNPVPEDRSATGTGAANGRVVRFPRRPTDTGPTDAVPGTAVEPAGEVVDGELVSPEDEAALAARRTAAQAAVWHAGQVARVVRGGVTHPRTRAVVRGGAGLARTGGGRGWRLLRRHGTFVFKGAEQQRLRRRAEKGQADARAASAAALAAGDLARVTDLHQQIQDQRSTAVAVARQRFELGWLAITKLACTVGVVIGVALVCGIVNGFGHWFGVWNATDVLRTVGAVLRTGAAVVSWLVTHVWLVGAGVAGVWGFRRWKDGTRLGEQVLPETLRREVARTSAYVELTEHTLVAALANIGNQKLSAAIKDGWPHRDTDNAWVRFPMIDGKGYSAKLRLPLGCSVAVVNKAKELLAHNLGCRPQELFIESDPTDPTVLDLFRLEPGVLREPVGPYPLLTEGTTDYWTGFPIGISPRGDVVTTPVFERNFVFAGIMGSGKTTFVLDLLAGAALDPLVDIDVFVFADNFDYDPLRPVLSTLVKGDSPDNVEGCIGHIQRLHADLSVRGRLLEKHGERSVTRAIAAKEPGLRPRVVVIDECQSFFRQGNPAERQALIDTVVRFYSAARKYAINLVFITPVPSDKSLPRDLVAVTSNKACGAIGDKLRNNVVLGEKAHENGISALGLKPKTKDQLNDAGTAVTIGFMDNPGIVRSFYLGADDLALIAERGVQLRGGQPAGTLDAPAADRDWLVDLVQVCEGHDKVNLAHAATWLKKHAPHHRPYQGLDGKTLAEMLSADEIGVTVTWPSRVPTANTDSIRAVLASRRARPE